MDMQLRAGSAPPRQRIRFPLWLGACLFAAIATFFLWEEHRAHIMGALPYVLLLLCPVLHLLMHRGHGGHRHTEDGDAHPDQRAPGARP